MHCSVDGRITAIGHSRPARTGLRMTDVGKTSWRFLMVRLPVPQRTLTREIARILVVTTSLAGRTATLGTHVLIPQLLVSAERPMICGPMAGVRSGNRGVESLQNRA